MSGYVSLHRKHLSARASMFASGSFSLHRAFHHPPNPISGGGGHISPYCDPTRPCSSKNRKAPLSGTTPQPSAAITIRKSPLSVSQLARVMPPARPRRPREPQTLMLRQPVLLNLPLWQMARHALGMPCHCSSADSFWRLAAEGRTISSRLSWILARDASKHFRTSIFH